MLSLRGSVKRNWCIFASLLLAAVPAGGSGIAKAAGADAPLPRETVFLFVASWCAPCRGELARIGEIAEAAAPRHVIVVPLDSGKATDAMVRKVPPSLLWRPEQVSMAQLRERLLSQTAGLPFSAMTNGSGAICGLHRAPLDARGTRAMAEGCRATP